MNLDHELRELAADSSWKSATVPLDGQRLSMRRRERHRQKIVTGGAVVLALCVPLALYSGLPGQVLASVLHTQGSAEQAAQTLPELSSASSIVVAGKAIEQHPITWHGSMYTVTTISVSHHIAGSLSLHALSIRQLGTHDNESGRSGTIAEDVAPLLQKGTDYLLYLTQEPNGSSFHNGEYFNTSAQGVWKRVGHSNAYVNVLQDITVPRKISLEDARLAAAEGKHAPASPSRRS